MEQYQQTTRQEKYFPEFKSPATKWRFIRYIISGSSAAIINVGILYVLTDIWKMWYLYGATIAFIAGVVVSFTMQKYFTFRDNKTHNGHLRRQLASFLLVALINIIANATIVFVLVEYFKLWHITSQIISSGCIALITF